MWLVLLLLKITKSWQFCWSYRVINCACGSDWTSLSHTHMQGLDLHVCLSLLLPLTHAPHRLVLMWMQSWWTAEILCTTLQTMDMQTCWSTSCQRELRLMWGWREGGEKEDKRGGGSKPICLCVLKARMSSGQSSPTTPPQILGNVLSLWGKPKWLAAQAENFTACVHK